MTAVGPLGLASHASSVAAHSLISSAAVTDLTPACSRVPALHQISETSKVLNIMVGSIILSNFPCLFRVLAALSSNLMMPLKS